MEETTSPGETLPAPAIERRVYIAGPMRGIPLFNFPAFDAARDLLASQGWIAISPADMDRKMDGFEGTKPEEVLSFEHYMRRDITALLYCDAIAVLPGWEESQGARIEMTVARALALPVLSGLTGEMIATEAEVPSLLMRFQKGVVTLTRLPEGTHVWVHAALGAAGAAGRVCDVIGEMGGLTPAPWDEGKAELREGMGDILWHLALLAWLNGVTLEDLAREVFTKHLARNPGVFAPMGAA